MENGTESAAAEKSEVIRVIEKIELYYMPFLVAFGSIGNCLSVVVFFSTKLRKLSSSFYLSALAVSDTGFLFIIFISWLNMVDIPFFNRPVVCEVSVYVSSVCSFLSVWFVVAFTVERFIAVGYPLKRPSMCTVSRAKMVIACLTATSLLLYLPHIFIAGLQPKVQYNVSDLAVPQPFLNLSDAALLYPNDSSTVMLCGLDKDYYDLSNILNSIDFFIVLLLPVIAIFMINASICMTVWRLARVRRTMTLTSVGHVNGLDGRRPVVQGSSSIRSHSSQTKVTKMLLIVSTVFICLNLPSYICRLILHFQEVSNTDFFLSTTPKAFTCNNKPKTNIYEMYQPCNR